PLWHPLRSISEKPFPHLRPDHGRWPCHRDRLVGCAATAAWQSYTSCHTSTLYCSALSGAWYLIWYCAQLHVYPVSTTKGGRSRTSITLLSALLHPRRVVVSLLEWNTLLRRTSLTFGGLSWFLTVLSLEPGKRSPFTRSAMVVIKAVEEVCLSFCCKR